MASVQEEAARAVSAAISEADGDLLSAIDAAQDNWQKELDAAKANARTLLATILAERESLRTSLATAAELWRILRPKDDVKDEPHPAHDPNNPAEKSYFVANQDQILTVRALENVSHTLFLMEFIMAAPEAIDRAQLSLSELQEVGLMEESPGNAAKLVEAHAILTAVERLRDLVLLESPEDRAADSSASLWFASAVDTRTLLEDIVLRNIFSNMLRISNVNPRVLVAAARIVEYEEEEDKWWSNHLLRGGNTQLGSIVRPFGAQQYRKRAALSVVESLQSIFNAKEKQLGLVVDSDSDTECHSQSHQPNSSSKPMDIPGILDWIEQRRAENETVRRFVVPCLPPSFGIAELYEKELHRQFMRLITQLLHLIHPDGSMILSEADLILLTSWYCKYKEEVGDHDEAIDSFLSESDRERLISALQKHCRTRIAANITAAIAADRKAAKTMTGPKSRSSKVSAAPTEVDSHCQTELPDIVLGCVNEQVTRMLALKVQGMDHAIAQTAAECLMSFQKEMRHAMISESKTSSEEAYPLYICATANNMARCLEYSEDLRDIFVPLASDKDRSEIEEKMETVIEGFRSTASMALQILINGMDSSLDAHASRLYAPRTGTEIMLDIVATLGDFFSDYELLLLPYHFEHLAIESLKRIVVWYLAPFLRLSQNKIEESSARRFTSLPTFDEKNVVSTVVTDEENEVAMFSRRSENVNGDKEGVAGLEVLNGAAVVAQIDKDISNLVDFMSKKVVSFQKKQLQPTVEPLHAIRALYTCAATTYSLCDAFRDAKSVIARALSPSWVLACGVSGQFNTRIAEVIWESRGDVSPVVLLEAITTIRSNADRRVVYSPKESRMSSFDDGRIWGSRNSEVGGTFSERILGRDSTYLEQTGSSSSLLWAPSLPRSSRR